MNTMKALIKERPVYGQEWKKGLRLVDKPIPTLERSDYVKMEVVASAICGTDVGIYDSKDSIAATMQNMKSNDVITGHEFCGKIVEAGDISRLTLAIMLKSKGEWQKGDKVLSDFIGNRSYEELANDKDLIKIINEKFLASSEMHVVCGQCPLCRQGEGHACVNTVIKGVHEDGIFTKYVTVPVQNVSLFPQGTIPVEIIAFMDAIGNAIHTVQSVNLMGRTVAVLGAGVIGLVSIAAAKMSGASKIFVTDVVGENLGNKIDRLKLAKTFGASDCFDMANESDRQRFVPTIMAATDGTGVDAVLEMSGSYKAYQNAFDVLRPGGTMSLLGIPGGTMDMDFSKHIIWKGITIKGIIGRRMFDTWDRMIEMLNNGLAEQLMNNGFVTHDLPLDKFEEGFKALHDGTALKVILRPI